ncbi:transcriptional repressor [Alginatibacterium sediminis]|uniref:Transcriptional repressor n=1 Tax=Alginatibacterium sediminis TaxID=2164068 RepID=A0A420E9X2_9ALTE|nr:Fur family transcriptional regulator [Alginatibacterium sediminis]RKF17474.1 transcriptional repressor [Alginatibacterium sediminis]
MPHTHTNTHSLTDPLMDKVANKCAENGARLTPKRSKLLACLLKSNHALSAYEIIDLFKQQNDENISAMSAYRILEFLEEQQLVHKLQLANKYIACKHIACDHSHETSQFLICIKCSKVREVSIDKAVVEAISHNVTDAGFTLASRQLEVNCVCDKCTQL